jgi:hypothetical protein
MIEGRTFWGKYLRDDIVRQAEALTSRLAAANAEFFGNEGNLVCRPDLDAQLACMHLSHCFWRG